MTALLEAAEHGHLPVVRMLVEVYGVDVFQKTKVYQIHIHFVYSISNIKCSQIYNYFTRELTQACLSFLIFSTSLSASQSYIEQVHGHSTIPAACDS